MTLEERLLKLKKENSEAKEKKARMEGNLETLLNTMKEFGCDNVEDFASSIEEQKQKLKELEKENEQKIAEFEKEFGDELNKD